MEVLIILAVLALGYFWGKSSAQQRSGSITSAPISADNKNVSENPSPAQASTPKPIAYTPDSPSLFRHSPCTCEGIEGIEITEYVGFNDRRIVIPPTIEGLPVISIGEKAFYNSSVNEVILPDSVVRICSHAFAKCGQLRSVQFPTDLKFIGNSAFSETSVLQSALLPEGLTQIEKFAFYFSGISYIHFPSSLKAIPNNCCHDCYRLRKADISEGVTRIGCGVFEISHQLCRNRGYTNQLRYVIIPQSVEYIDFYAFKDREGLVMDVSTALVFEGMHTKIHKDLIGAYKPHPNRIVAYVLPGSETQKAAREVGFTIKPLREFSDK